jgi:hypothetical protein
MVVLDAGFNSLSNGASFNRSCLATTKRFLRNTRFLKKFLKINPVRIRSATCVGFLVDCVEYRIQFSIEWYQFQSAESKNKISSTARGISGVAKKKFLFKGSAN